MRENQAILHSLDGILVWDYKTHRYAVWSIRDHTSRNTDIVRTRRFDEDTPKLTLNTVIPIPGIYLPRQELRNHDMGPSD